VIKIKYFGTSELWTLALLSGIGVAWAVKAFVKISIAHFNPAVTLGFLISGHMVTKQIVVYLSAQAIRAFAASAIIKYMIGTYASLGTNTPDYASYPILLVFAVEIMVTAFLMAIIFTSVHTRGLKGLGWMASGAIIGLDIFLFSFISGAAINPIRFLASATLSEILAIYGYTGLLHSLELLLLHSSIKINSKVAKKYLIN
jgi:aquaporin Z